MTDELAIYRDEDSHAPPAMYSAVFQGSNPMNQLEAARKLVGAIHQNCKGPKWIANIQGREYPTVDWWGAVGSVLGLVAREISVERVDRPNGYLYQATVGVFLSSDPTVLITQGSAICSTIDEGRWAKASEYAVRSMSVTRATGKAFRTNLSFLAVLAGLNPTPAEEVSESQAQAPPPAPKKRKPAARAKAKAAAPDAQEAAGESSGSIYQNWIDAMQGASAQKSLDAAWAACQKLDWEDAQLSELTDLYNWKTDQFDQLAG